MIYHWPINPKKNDISLWPYHVVSLILYPYWHFHILGGLLVLTPSSKVKHYPTLIQSKQFYNNKNNFKKSLLITQIDQFNYQLSSFLFNNTTTTFYLTTTTTATTSLLLSLNPHILKLIMNLHQTNRAWLVICIVLLSFYSILSYIHGNFLNWNFIFCYFYNSTIVNLKSFFNIFLFHRLESIHSSSLMN